MDEIGVKYYNDSLQLCRDDLEKSRKALDYNKPLTADELFDLRVSLALTVHRLDQLNECVKFEDTPKKKRFFRK